MSHSELAGVNAALVAHDADRFGTELARLQSTSRTHFQDLKPLLKERCLSKASLSYFDQAVPWG